MANLMRRLAASSVVALAFSPLAQAGDNVPDRDALKKYYNPLTNVIAQASGSPTAHLYVGGFVSELEAALRSPPERPRPFLSPQENSTNMLVIAAVVPPKGYESLPIPVCAQQNNKVIGTWQITNKGEVLPVAWTGATTGEVVPGVGVKPACNAFIKVARADMAQQIAEAEAKKSGQTAGLSAAPVVANSNNGSLRPALQ